VKELFPVANNFTFQRKPPNAGPRIAAHRRFLHSTLASLYESLCFPDRKIAEQEMTLKAIAKKNEPSQRRFSP
jgi:hypothetical protein